VNGGARPGAGRPRSTARVIKEEQVVFKRLRGGAQLGWEVLAGEYPSLIRLAVAVAMGRDDEKPNVSMLKTLLELLPKVVGDASGDESSKLHGVLGDIRAIIHESKNSG
tara:strand:- start:1075 stop:1401 length:327 start_codon:yes stop_codon:yes gene_type:complete